MNKTISNPREIAFKIAEIVVNPDEKIVVIADGRSNNINNQLTTEHIARIQINEWYLTCSQFQIYR